MSPGRGGPLCLRRMILTRFRLDAPHFCRSRCRMRDRHVSDWDCRLRSRSARIGAGRLVRSVMGKLHGRGLRWCWFPIAELRSCCICYDRCGRRLVSSQSWIGKLAGLKHIVKAEPEEAAHEHAHRKIHCDGSSSFLCARIPGAHGLLALRRSRWPQRHLNHYTQMLMPAHR
jgi:hypothetical protein